MVTVYCDGMTRGNNLPKELRSKRQSYIAVVIRTGQNVYLGEKREYTYIEESDALTSNLAEWHALRRALQILGEMRIWHEPSWCGTIYSDSILVVNQFNGNYKIKDERIKELYDECQELAKFFYSGIQMFHVRRNLNPAGLALEHHLERIK